MHKTTVRNNCTGPILEAEGLTPKGSGKVTYHDGKDALTLDKLSGGYIRNCTFINIANTNDEYFYSTVYTNGLVVRMAGMCVMPISEYERLRSKAGE